MARPGVSKRSYEDFEPFCRWERSPDHDILHVHLQGFKRQELKIQMNSTGVMTITGERCLDCEHNRWARFSKETRVPTKDIIKTNEIHAKLSAGILSIVMPKKPLVLPSPLPSSSSTDAGHDHNHSQPVGETEHHHHQPHEEHGPQVLEGDHEFEAGTQRVVGSDLMVTRKLRDVGGVMNVVVVVAVVTAVMVAVGAVLAGYRFRSSE